MLRQQSQKLRFVGALMLPFHASFHTVHNRNTRLTAVSSHCLVALPTKYVCFQESHAAKRLFRNFK